MDLRLRLDELRVRRRDVLRPEVALIDLDQAAQVSSGSSSLMTGIIPTWHASDSSTGQRLVVKPTMWESASAPGLQAALFPLAKGLGPPDHSLVRGARGLGACSAREQQLYPLPRRTRQLALGLTCFDGHST